MVPADYLYEYVLQKSSLGRRKYIIGSLVSLLGIFDDEFLDLLSVGKLSKVISWYKNLGMRVQTHIYHSITFIAFDEAFTPI